MQEVQDIVFQFSTPAERLIRTLITFKQRYGEKHESILPEINYAIHKVNERSIYHINAEDDQKRKVL